MAIQIWIYILYNFALMYSIKKLGHDQNAAFMEFFEFLLFVGTFYFLLGGFTPIVMVTFFNRSWCFMCFPKAAESADIRKNTQVQMSAISDAAKLSVKNAQKIASEVETKGYKEEGDGRKDEYERGQTEKGENVEGN